MQDIASPRSLGSCSSCGSLSLSGQWLQAFGVAICNSCRQDEELITKVRCLNDKQVHCTPAAFWRVQVKRECAAVHISE